MSDIRLRLMEAIARRRTVTAHYNGVDMMLAPHQLFERRGDLFVSALNLSKNWRSPDDWKLGHFKLDGLAVTALHDEEFEPLASFSPAPPLDGDTVLLAV